MSVTNQRLKTLKLRGFRNLAPYTWTPGPHFNVISGDNGSGKSSLIEAVAYVSGLLESFRGASAADMIGDAAQDAVMTAMFEERLLDTPCEVHLSRQVSRKVTIADKRVTSLAAFHRRFHVVVFHPGDVALVQGSPEWRRGLLDRILIQLDSVYASALSSFDKALRSRNRLLKGEPVNWRAVGVFDQLIASSGSVVGQARDKLVTQLAPVVERVFGVLFGDHDVLRVAYAPKVTPEPDALIKSLFESRALDQARGYTGRGPHVDDLAISIESKKAKHHASQGQSRSIAMALKLAELYVLAEPTGINPILLLDDVSSELDDSRQKLLFGLLSDLGGQVFLTTTHARFIPIQDKRRDFKVKNGEIGQLGVDEMGETS